MSSLHNRVNMAWQNEKPLSRSGAPEEIDQAGAAGAQSGLLDRIKKYANSAVDKLKNGMKSERGMELSDIILGTLAKQIKNFGPVVQWGLAFFSGIAEIMILLFFSFTIWSRKTKLHFWDTTVKGNKYAGTVVKALESVPGFLLLFLASIMTTVISVVSPGSGLLFNSLNLTVLVTGAITGGCIRILSLVCAAIQGTYMYDTIRAGAGVIPGFAVGIFNYTSVICLVLGAVEHYKDLCYNVKPAAGDSSSGSMVSRNGIEDSWFNDDKTD